MRHTVSLLVLVLLASATHAESSTYRFGPLGVKLTDAEVGAAVASLSSTDGNAPLAVLGWYSRIVPLVWYVDIFSAPSMRGNRVRRGTVSRVRCTLDSEEHCLKWESVNLESQYAQVADNLYSGFSHRIGVRNDRERPFTVGGTFSDDELMGLVDYIRSQACRTK